ncbi:MAG: lipase maturation factor family protein [Acidobacteriota bacterium]
MPGSFVEDRPTPGAGRGRVTRFLGSALGFVYLAAFLSLSVQLVDLAGSRGLLPLADYLDRLRAADMTWLERLHAFPTVLWARPTDGALRLLPLAGAAASLPLIVGYGGRVIPLLLWVLYLSGITAARDFFYYQWDNLLLEIGFLAIFLPGRGSPPDPARGRTLPEPSPVLVFLLRWLLFRLLFESGLAKLVYGWDDWLDVVGMTFYYETAPLPSWGGWLVQQLPVWFHRASVYFTLVLELVLPFFIFMGRPFRIVFFLAHLLFQVSIALTSNYGFFNLLSIVVSLSVLEDRDLRAATAWARPRSRRGPGPAPAAPPPEALCSAGTRWRRALHRFAPWALAAFVVPASIVEAVHYFIRRPAVSRVVAALRAPYRPYRSVNRYHLFPGIVRRRIVAEIQGTVDGREWLPYRPRYAPGDPRAAPPMTLLHNPRFPFHLSFYTLGRGGRDREYLGHLAKRLCCDPEAVSNLFEVNPFPESGPAARRSVYYRYRFGTWEDLRRAGVYWLREPARRPTRAVACRCAPGGGGGDAARGASGRPGDRAPSTRLDAVQ